MSLPFKEGDIVILEEDMEGFGKKGEQAIVRTVFDQFPQYQAIAITKSAVVCESHLNLVRKVGEVIIVKG